MKKVIFMALAAVFMVSSGFVNVEEDDYGCRCTVAWTEYVLYQGQVISIVATSSADTNGPQACSHWAGELNQDREVIGAIYDTGNCAGSGLNNDIESLNKR